MKPALAKAGEAISISGIGQIRGRLSKIWGLLTYFLVELDFVDEGAINRDAIVAGFHKFIVRSWWYVIVHSTTVPALRAI